jgi:hypothetical protein
MKPTAPIAAAIAALLISAAPAAAKEVSKVQVCGAASCTTVDKSDNIGGGGDGLMVFAQDNGVALEDLQQPAPYYRVRITVDEGDSDFGWSIRYVPSAKLIATRGESGELEWMDATDDFIAAMGQVTRGLDPIPAARMRSWMPTPLKGETPPPAPPAKPVAAPDESTPWLLYAGVAALLAVAAAFAARHFRGRLRPV